MTLPTPISGTPLRIGSTVRKRSSIVSTAVMMVAPNRVPSRPYSSRIPSVPELTVAAPMTIPPSARTAIPRLGQPGCLSPVPNGIMAATASCRSGSGVCSSASHSAASSSTSRLRKVGVSLLTSRTVT